MRGQEVVSTEVNGIELKGLISHRSESAIEVKIVKPYRNVSKELHIPYFSRSSRSFIGEHGNTTAMALLRELFIICHYVNDNIHALKEKLVASDDMDTFFNEAFPVVIPINTREDVINILEER